MPDDRPRTAANDVEDDELTRRIIGCAIKVHRALGVGLLESAYEACLTYELIKQGFSVVRQSTLPVIYDGVHINVGFKPDLIIDNELIIELKTVSQLLPIHEAQMLTYLRLAGIERGLLMNFHTQPLWKGIRRFVLSRHSR